MYVIYIVYNVKLFFLNLTNQGLILPAMMWLIPSYGSEHIGILVRTGNG